MAAQAPAQAPAQPVPESAQAAPGIAPDWDLKPKVLQILPAVQRLRPILERLQPEKWTQAGAPTAYERLYRESLNGIASVESIAARLAEQPSRLSLATEALIRLESLVELTSSVSQAVRKYQNPAVADLLDGEIGSAGAPRGWLRQLVSDLAALRERELETAEQEAQRCRTQTLRPGGRK